MSNYYLNGYTPPSGVDSAQAVKEVQATLNNMGYTLNEDGVWGPNTQAAYSAYMGGGTTAQSAAGRFSGSSANRGLNVDDVVRAYEVAEAAAQERARAQAQISMNAERAREPEYKKDLYDGNAQRHLSYMQAINPYGQREEDLRAMGLRGSGLQETTLIQAGNAYGNALNENKLTYDRAIHHMNEKIEEYRLTGELTALDAAMSYRQKAAEAQLEAEMFNLNLQYKYDQLAEEQRQFDAKLAMSAGGAGATAAASSGSTPRTASSNPSASSNPASSGMAPSSSQGYLAIREVVEGLAGSGRRSQARDYIDAQVAKGNLSASNANTLVKLFG